VTSQPDHLIRFRPKDRLDRVFEVGIVLKGLTGLLELVGGVLLLLVTPGQHQWSCACSHPARAVREPARLHRLPAVHTADGLTGPGLLFGAAYLLIHGIVKVALVAALLRNKMWAYPWMIGVLLAFIVYQTYQIALGPTVGLIALTVFDIAIVALTWREYQRQRADRAHPAAHL